MNYASIVLAQMADTAAAASDAKGLVLCRHDAHECPNTNDKLLLLLLLPLLHAKPRGQQNKRLDFILSGVSGAAAWT